MKKQLKADILLVFVAMFWGSQVLFKKMVLYEMDVFNLNSIRFLIGFVLTFAFLYKKLNINKKTIQYSAIIGINYFTAAALATFGVKYTTVINAGFLTCLAGVFVPIIGALVFKERPNKKAILCVVTMFIGIYTMTMVGTAGFTGINLGDILCILCSLSFAVHILLVNYFVKRAEPLSLSVFQMGFVSIYSIVASFIFESPHLPQSNITWLYMAWLTLACTAIAIIMQNTAQKNTSPTHAGIIFSSEPVFAALFAFVFIGETLTFWGYIGAIILLLSIVVLEIDFPGLHHGANAKRATKRNKKNG